MLSTWVRSPSQIGWQEYPVPPAPAPQLSHSLQLGLLQGECMSGSLVVKVCSSHLLSESSDRCAGHVHCRSPKQWQYRPHGPLSMSSRTFCRHLNATFRQVLLQRPFASAPNHSAPSRSGMPLSHFGMEMDLASSMYPSICLLPEALSKITCLSLAQIRWLRLWAVAMAQALH